MKLKEFSYGLYWGGGVSSGSSGGSSSSGGGSGSGGSSSYSIAKQAGVSKETFNSGKSVRLRKEVMANLKSGKLSGKQLKKVQSKAKDKVNQLKNTRREIYKKTNGTPYGTKHYQTYKNAKTEIKMLNEIRSISWNKN